MTPRRHWNSVSDARLERAIARILRTIPMLRYRGNCLGCEAGLTARHEADCPVTAMEWTMMEHRGWFSKKEVRHFTFRKSQAKAQ